MTHLRKERDANNLLDTLVIVPDPDGEIIAESDDINPGIITDSRIEALALPVDGEYTIEAYSFANATGGSCTLTITSDRDE